MTDTSREAVEALAECAHKNSDGHIQGTPWGRRDTGQMLADCSTTLRALLDERDKLLAELEWRPIETAPRDGTKFLAHDPKRDVKVAMAKFVPNPCPWVSGFKDGFYCQNGREINPTKWMPLPAAPVQP